MMDLFTNFHFLKVYKTYNGGTFRHGPLHQISLVGTVTEEVGGYFPKFLELLEQNIFLKLTMPWGETSIVDMESPLESNDGPILWVRPGEQMLPTAELNAGKSPAKRKRAGINELRVSFNNKTGYNLISKAFFLFLFFCYLESPILAPVFRGTRSFV